MDAPRLNAVAGETGFFKLAPKEQPPRKLSGNRDRNPAAALESSSVDTLFTEGGKPAENDVQRRWPVKSLRFSDRWGDVGMYAFFHRFTHCHWNPGDGT